MCLLIEKKLCKPMEITLLIYILETCPNNLKAYPVVDKLTNIGWYVKHQF